MCCNDGRRGTEVLQQVVVLRTDSWCNDPGQIRPPWAAQRDPALTACGTGLPLGALPTPLGTLFLLFREAALVLSSYYVHFSQRFLPHGGGGGAVACTEVWAHWASRSPAGHAAP